MLTVDDTEHDPIILGLSVIQVFPIYNNDTKGPIKPKQVHCLLQNHRISYASSLTKKCH